MKPTRHVRGRLLTVAMVAALSSISTNVRADSLHDAAESCDLAGVQLLVDSGANLEVRSGKGETALMVTSINGCAEVAALLIAKGADIKSRNDAGLTMLHAAAYGGDSKVVELLLKNGAQINEQENKFKATPLHFAAEENHKAAVQVLLKNGADLTATEVNGFTAVTRASFRLHQEILEILFNHGGKCQPMTLHFVKIGARTDAFGEWLTKQCKS